jgi:hypothetical protein
MEHVVILTCKEMQLQRVLCYSSDTNFIIFKIKHKLYIPSGSVPPSAPKINNSRCAPKETYLQLLFPSTDTKDKNNNPSLSGKEHFYALLQQRKYSTTNHCDNDGELLSIHMYSKLEVPEYWLGINKFTACVCGQSQQ